MDTVIVCLLRLLMSTGLGFAIGFERKLRAKEASVRTHTIVSIGACLYTIISIYGFSGEYDTARVAAQVVSGIGFLGAGMIFYHKQILRGLTTAAGIWVTAGVGMACGCGMYYIALGACVILIIVQFIMHSKLRIFQNKHYYKINVKYYTVDGTESEKLKQIFCADRFNKITATREGDKIVYNTILNSDHLTTYKEILDIIKENDFIISIDREDDEI